MPDKYGWISVLERMPTKEDADDNGDVLWESRDMYRRVFGWDDGGTSTHWQPLPKPPVRKVRKPLGAWANVYLEDILRIHRTKELADADPWPGRIACVRLTGEYEVEE